MVTDSVPEDAPDKVEDADLVGSTDVEKLVDQVNVSVIVDETVKVKLSEKVVESETVAEELLLTI
ncbi:MAG: hypothetical protein FJ267_17515 [Planctomycetes bacterium]|nr:hypothetical protein [Planctomycetota bacterium]